MLLNKHSQHLCWHMKVTFLGCFLIVHLTICLIVLLEGLHIIIIIDMLRISKFYSLTQYMNKMAKYFNKCLWPFMELF